MGLAHCQTHIVAVELNENERRDVERMMNTRNKEAEKRDLLEQMLIVSRNLEQR
jgi:hypothetical protein